jgi:NAD(P)-dependent dehydrogenase (short-subunit alcohol dehydrogenase family)
MTKQLEGLVALVTGAGNGLGRATALELAVRGAIVGVNDLKPEFVEAAVAQIVAAGGKAVPLVHNISTREGVRAAVQDLVKATGRLDILVNNAAWVRYQGVADILPETMDRMLDVGFKSVVWGIQAAAEFMDPAHGGSIINIASAAGFRSAPNSIVYSGIKAGVMGITRAAAVDLGPKNIRVTAIAPSAIPTEGTAKHRTAEKDAKRIERTPLGRLGAVEDIANAVCFLAGPDSRFITGEILTVDGGITASIV